MNEQQPHVAETYVQRWFCQNNEILWERNGHYKEEVAALVVLLRDAQAEGLEEAAKIADGARPILHGNAFRAQREACTAIASKCRARAAQVKGGA